MGEHDCKLWCWRPWRATCVLSDGTVVCSCIDSGKKEPLGNMRERDFDEIWKGALYKSLRERILTDINAIELCAPCANRTPLMGPEPRLENIPYPEIGYIEPTSACNLACPGCDREVARIRDGMFMDYDLYQRVVDQIVPHLRYLELYVIGESFAHPRIFDMIKYAKTVNPDVLINISTNGVYLADPRRQEKLIESGLDALIFSVDGASQEVYEQYRRGGNFEKAVEAMRGLMEKRRAAGARKPTIVWRYILFHWSDGDAEMERARSIANDIGVDYFTWHLNCVRPEDSSRRFFPGSPEWHKVEFDMYYNLEQRAMQEYLPGLTPDVPVA
jgi:Radical SAM superfamily/Iron-sulfur cluster-binding domain